MTFLKYTKDQALEKYPFLKNISKDDLKKILTAFIGMQITESTEFFECMISVCRSGCSPDIH